MSRLWLSDTDDGIRELYGDLAPNGELVAPDRLIERLDAGERPTALMIDGASLRRLPPDLLGIVVAMPRVAVCTGHRSEIDEIVAMGGSRARILEKPFSLEDFERLLDWLSEETTTA